MKISQKFSKLLSGHYFQTEIFKGHNFLKNYVNLWFLISAHHLMMLYICTKFRENISKGFKVFEQIDFQTEISKGEKFHKNVGGIMVIVLCTSPDSALYFYQVP